MRVVYTPPPDVVREQRKQRYLEKWPLEAQLEALTEASMGRPGKLEKLREDLAEIRRTLPLYPGPIEGGDK